jgi:hypothetical protein
MKFYVDIIRYARKMVLRYDNNDVFLEDSVDQCRRYDRLGRQAMGRRSQLAVLIPSKIPAAPDRANARDRP